MDLKRANVLLPLRVLPLMAVAGPLHSFQKNEQWDRNRYRTRACRQQAALRGRTGCVEAARVNLAGTFWRRMCRHLAGSRMMRSVP